MKELGQKNLIYSLLLAAALLLFLIGYFIWMLPSLYVSYQEEQNLKAIKEQHQAFMETGTYEGIHVKNPTACISVKIPFEENYIGLTSKAISVKIIATDDKMDALMDDMQAFVRQISLEKPDVTPKNQQIARQIQDKVGQYQEQLERQFKSSTHLPVKIEFLHKKDIENLYYGEVFRVHHGPGQMTIIESAVSDDNSHYTNYLAIEKAFDGVVFSVLPAITPQMDEIRPIVMQSVPMLCAVILMLVLLFSQIYSDGIVRPVYRKLQDFNQRLLEENERQELFLRASSHQLKTPITAALLLLDGMIGQVGKYKDRETYLPKTKEQLLSMRRMVEAILSLEQTPMQLHPARIQLYGFVQVHIEPYKVAAEAKQLEISIEGDPKASFWADSDILSKVIDNLLSNAVAHTPNRNRILVILSEQKLTIRNEGVTIPPDLLPHIFGPFVRGDPRGDSHGLGLYIAAYYAKLINATLDIRNIESNANAVQDGMGCGVEAILEYDQKSRWPL